MNKKLIAAAITAALVAPMAAHAAVTVYGKADLSVDSLDTGGQDVGTAKAKSLYVQSNSSRVGVRASEDLGGGLKAVAGFEWTVNATAANGATALGNRNQTVGLAGSFGEVDLGHHDSPMKILSVSNDVFLEHIGDTINFTSGTWNQRMPHMIMYTSPKLGGSWTIRAQYSPDQGTADSSMTSVSADGMAGPVHLWIANESHKKPAGQSDEKGTWVAASMKFGMLEAYLNYAKFKNNGGTSGNDNKFTSLGAVMHMSGMNLLRVQWATIKNDLTSDDKATMLAIGVQHNFSKSVAVYADYATVSNKAAAKYNLDGGAHGGAGNAVSVGNDPKGLSVGMTYSF